MSNMELILLNIGLENGLITPTLFTILVFMAIVTTLMASPIFEYVYGRFRVGGYGGCLPRRRLSRHRLATLQERSNFRRLKVGGGVEIAPRPNRMT